MLNKFKRPKYSAGERASFVDISTWSQHFRHFVLDHLNIDGVFLLRLIANNAGDLAARELIGWLWRLYRARIDGPSEPEDIGVTEMTSFPVKKDSQSQTFTQPHIERIKDYRPTSTNQPSMDADFVYTYESKLHMQPIWPPYVSASNIDVNETLFDQNILPNKTEIKQSKIPIYASSLFKNTRRRGQAPNPPTQNNHSLNILTPQDPLIRSKATQVATHIAKLSYTHMEENDNRNTDKEESKAELSLKKTNGTHSNLITGIGLNLPINEYGIEENDAIKAIVKISRESDDPKDIIFSHIYNENGQNFNDFSNNHEDGTTGSEDSIV
ncbi:unnamed protein product [Protopolystoma xenopodis]|uniref:Uncharacterized protein n=1 Tax=Protopolystoma xenopodis TaxID=117903 RepID=A0A448WRU9_9PLAT|nr:unnamed protein product [Protopolystoma xenopodis]